MRQLVIVLGMLTLAACSKAPESQENGPSNKVTSAPGVAFSYDYGFRIPSTHIADVQDRHAQACERLGQARCRITGMSYNVDNAGTVSADLRLSLAAPIARAFAREGVKATEAAGGALIGASITGTEAALAETEQVSAQSRTDAARLSRELDGPGLSAAERAELLRQRAAVVAQQRAATIATSDARVSVAEAPVSFRYQAGRGVGLSARLADAGQMAAASFVTTLSVALTLLATLGPPAVLLIIVFLLWRRFARHWWLRLVAGRDAGEVAT